jgi:hypothetical protein
VVRGHVAFETRHGSRSGSSPRGAADRGPRGSGDVLSGTFEFAAHMAAHCGTLRNPWTAGQRAIYARQVTLGGRNRRLLVRPSPRRTPPVTQPSEPTHGAFLSRPTPVRGRQEVDGVVVSTVHGAEHILPSIELAAELECPIVALCSGNTHAADAVALGVELDAGSCTAVDIPADYTHPLLAFGTSVLQEADPGEFQQLSVKRNLALLLARLARWDRVLLLDDDVQGLDPGAIERAAGLLPPGGVAAFAAPEFPDNSVVCHAHRLAGGLQDVFVSGGACVVDVLRTGSFFPAIYNQDWLFFYDAVRLGMVIEAGTVRKLWYDPFRDPALAGLQEFGDVLAEGLMSLLHKSASLALADESYWASFLRQRRDFIDGTATRLTQNLDRTASTDALACIAVARKRHCDITPRALKEYICVWRDDTNLWRSRLDSLPDVRSLNGGLRYLDLLGPLVSRL